jgi:hypothetical protein
VRLKVVAVVATTGLALGACGTSKEDEAKNDVCDARADIQREVDNLKQLTPSTITADSVSKSLQAIRNNLKKIGDAQADLSDDRRSQVEQANKAFAADVKEIGSTVLRSTSLEEAKTQLQQSVTQLSDTYSNTFAKVDCS